MASRAEIRENLPDTLPSDFGEWDASDTSAAAPSEARASEPRSATPAAMPNRESAPPEASRGLEPAGNVTPFPEPEVPPIVTRGFPAPVVRAPRRPPSSAPSAPLASTPDDSSFLRRMKSIDNVVGKLSTVDSRIDEITGSTASLMERKPDTPIFSAVAMEEEEKSQEDEGPKLLNGILEEDEGKAARRKWIISGCVFGVSLLLVGFQLFHYGTAGKLKDIVATTQAATTSADPDPVPDTFVDTKPTAVHPLQEKGTLDGDSQQFNNKAGESTQSPVVPAPIQTEMMQSQLMAPTRLPANARSVAPSDTPPPATLGGATMAALNGSSTMGNVFAGRSDAKVSGPRVVSVSAGVATGMLIRKTQPAYPPIAKSARVQGTVVLQATISRAGNVTNLKVVSGPPMLRQSAIDAVKTWQYKPYQLNNEPTDVDTTVNVVFSLGG
jgi:periplasmic protein TonB